MKLEGFKIILLPTLAAVSSLTIALAANEGSRTQGEALPKNRFVAVMPHSSKQDKADPGNVTRKVSFIAEAARDAFAVSDPIILKLTLANQTAAAISIIESSPAKDYELEIRNATGERLPLSEKGKRALDSPTLRSIVSRIDPGQVVHQEMDVSDLYDLPAASAAYTLTVKRRIFLQDKKKFAGVVSNPVKVMVQL